MSDQSLGGIRLPEDSVGCRATHVGSTSASKSKRFDADFTCDHGLTAHQNELAGVSLPLASRAERKVQGASSAHCTVHAVLGEGSGVRFQGESHLEGNHLYLLNTKANIVDIQEQVRFYFGWESNKQEQHVFDAVATLDTSERIAFAIKPEVRLSSGKFVAKIQAIAWWVYEKGFADEVRILTEADLDPVDLYNAKVLAAVREFDPDGNAAAEAILAALPAGSGLSLRELTQATLMGARGYRALIRLLRTGAARLQKRERIGPQAVIVNAVADHADRHLLDRPSLIAQALPYQTAA
ncbi:hypothetical protein [uncultured Pelagimonas sp.]|uniref:hypothetical protein n=1 Tax=uncultured Pelagimonas sp. TaxID=1618102 RepID=UPI00261E9ED7|nr:hypothetical protein [uncultured Pelagimonas sp.]